MEYEILQQRLKAQERLSANLLRILGQHIPYMASQLAEVAHEWTIDAKSGKAKSHEQLIPDVPRHTAGSGDVEIYYDTNEEKTHLPAGVKNVTDTLINYLKNTDVAALEPDFLSSQLRELVSMGKAPTPPVYEKPAVTFGQLRMLLDPVTTTINNIPKSIRANIAAIPATVFSGQYTPQEERQIATGIYQFPNGGGDALTFYASLRNCELLFTPATGSYYYRDATSGWDSMNDGFSSSVLDGDDVIAALTLIV